MICFNLLGSLTFVEKKQEYIISVRATFLTFNIKSPNYFPSNITLTKLECTKSGVGGSACFGILCCTCFVVLSRQLMSHFLVLYESLVGRLLHRQIASLLGIRVFALTSTSLLNLWDLEVYLNVFTTLQNQILPIFLF